jgi:hypothetical protein
MMRIQREELEGTGLDEEHVVVGSSEAAAAAALPPLMEFCILDIPYRT